MTDLQKLESRLGAVRVRLSEIAGAELTDETRGELDTLRIEYQDLEKRADAARMAGDMSPDKPATTETSEGREYGQLITRSNIGEIFDASFTHKPLTGATGELQTHLGMDLNQVPLALLRRQQPEDGRLEVRAVTPAPAEVGTNQMATLMYVFPMSAASFLRRESAHGRRWGTIIPNYDQRAGRGNSRRERGSSGNHRGLQHTNLGTPQDSRLATSTASRIKVLGFPEWLRRYGSP